MLYKIHHNGTDCHLRTNSFGENLSFLLEGASRRQCFPFKCSVPWIPFLRILPVLPHTSLETIHQLSAMKETRLIVITLFERKIATNGFIVWHSLFGGLYVCVKIDTLSPQTILQRFGH